MWDKYPFIAEIILEAFLKVDSKFFSNPGLIYKITASRIIIFSRKETLCKHSAMGSQIFQANAKNTYLIINQFLKHSDSSLLNS
jgi:hypothetical protein